MPQLAEARPDPDSRLELVADLIDATFASEGFTVHSALVRLTDGDDPEGFELGLLDLDGRSVTEALLGAVAENDCWALGAVTGGWAAPIGEGRPSGHPDAVRVRMTVLVDREGRIASRQEFADERAVRSAPSGLVVDALRRAFSLPTEPPSASVADLLTRVWLAQVIAAGRDARRNARRLTWANVARLHPAMQLLQRSGERAKADRLVEVATALARVLTWHEARSNLAARGWFGALVDRDVAAWMDDGMFSRWVLGEMPAFPSLLADARLSIPFAVAERLETAVHVLLAADDGTSSA